MIFHHFIKAVIRDDFPDQHIFAVRCPYATEACFNQEPHLREIEPNHFAACHRAGEV